MKRCPPLLFGLLLACPRVSAALPEVTLALPPEQSSAPHPDPDDGDAVQGRDDRCPTEPECENGIMDGDGCPERVPDEVMAIALERLHTAKRAGRDRVVS